LGVTTNDTDEGLRLAKQQHPAVAGHGTTIEICL